MIIVLVQTDTGPVFCGMFKDESAFRTAYPDHRITEQDEDDWIMSWRHPNLYGAVKSWDVEWCPQEEYGHIPPHALVDDGIAYLIDEPTDLSLGFRWADTSTPV